MRTIVRQGFRGLAICWLLGAVAANAQSPASVTAEGGKKSPKPVPIRRLARTAQSAFGNGPLTFEANRGQSAAAVRYLAHGQGYRLFLKPNEADFALNAPTISAGTNRAVQVKMHLTGGRTDTAFTPEQPLPGQVNYFYGSDLKQWHTHIPTFGQVRSKGVYPGVDVVYYGNSRRLEYDFIVAPKADPNVIRIDFEGATRSRIAADGSLNVTTPGGTLRWQRPLVYQTIAGKRRAVAAHFTVRADRKQGRNPGIGFAVAAYDHSRPLVIDPVLIFSTYLGGTGTGNSGKDEGHAIATDSAGNVYVTGRSDSPDFPVVHSGSPDAFVAKFSPTGTLLYASYLGGEGFDFANGIGVDSSGKAFVVGTTQSKHFPVTANAFQSVNLSPFPFPNSAAFLSKLSADGSTLLYSTYLAASEAGPSETVGNALALDSSGFAYITGYTSARVFPLRHAYQSVLGGNINMYVAKFDTNAVTANASLIYSTYLGGSGVDVGNGIVVDASGSACVVGDTTSANFPHTGNAVQAASGGGTDAVVAKLGPVGDTLLYGTYLGGGSTDNGKAIALDTQGLLYVTGNTSSSGFPHSPFAYQPFLHGSGSAFVVKLNPFAVNASDALLYATFLGGSSFEAGTGIAVDRVGCAWVTGGSASTNFPLSVPIQSVNRGGLDAFVSRFSPDGSQLLFSTYCGGSGYDNPYAIALDPDRNAVITGSTMSTNYPLSNPYQSTLRGDSDIFVTKLQARIADIEMTHVANRTSFAANENVSFLTTLTNHGPDDATNLVFTDTLTHASDPDAPFDTVTIFISAIGDLLLDYDLDNHHFTTRPGTLAAYSSLQYSLIVTASRQFADGTITSTVSESSATDDPNPGNNHPAPVTVAVTLPVTPHIDTLSPNNAAAGGAAFDLTVTGSNFVSGATVNWNGSPRATTFISSTRLIAHINAADIATPRTANVTVANPGASTSSSVPFFVGTPSLRATVTAVTHIGGFYQIQVQIQNTGTAAAGTATITSAGLGTTPSVTTPLPSLGTIAAGATVTTTLVYPGTPSRVGQVVLHILRIDYSGGSISASQRLLLP